MVRFRAHSYHIPLVILLGAVVSLYNCGGGGGGSSSSTPNERVTDAQALANTPLTRGGVTRLKNGNDDEDGASLIVPPGAVDQDADISIAATSTQPEGSPWGQLPVGGLFEIGPTGLSFNADNKALLTLPLSPGGLNSDLHIGRWNETTGSWEDVGGAIDGDFISAEVDHLSLYGVFPQGKSLVRILNDIAPVEDPSDLGIEVRYISGPLPPVDWPEGQYYPAYRALPEGGIDLKIGESRLMALPPGQYHFAVSFPPPYQIANSMYVRIPVLETGADDATVDQTITITGDDASSDNTVTNDSLADFPGSWQVVGANEPPEISCSAIVPAGVAVTNNDPDATGLPSRRVGVGPITVQDLLDSTAVELTGAATDPEAGAIDYFWTWPRGTLPTKDTAASGEEISRFFHPNPRREGRYDVFLTAYDQFHLFNECHWEITVRGNEKPVIGVIADDYVVDYGRFGPPGFDGFSAMDRGELGAPTGGATSWCEYVDTNADAGPDTTLLKTLPILPPAESPDHIFRPTQYPPGMTCVYAMVGDADGDSLAVSFRFPANGDLYDALTGAKITTTGQLDAYNATISTMAAGFPMPDVLESYAPQGALYALPIIWEAPDNMVLDLFSSMPTHDCRHLDGDPAFDVGPCVDIPGTYPDGGITAIVATVTDGLSREQIDDFGVGYGEDNIVRQDGSGGGAGGGGGGGSGNNPPICSNDEFTINMGSTLADPMSGTDVDYGDNLTFIVTSGPGDGGVNVNDNTYVPDGNYFGTDSFDYVVSDGQAQSEPCTVTITINEVRKYYVFKLSGSGYQKKYGGYADKVTGYEYDSYYLYQSELDGIAGTNFDNTAACANGPWPFPDLPPQIWETRSMALFAGPFDTPQEVDPYRCPVPSWVTSYNPICNQWVHDSDPKYWTNITSICGP
jgi:hypothetical protein